MKEYLNRIRDSFYIDFAEFVGANVPFDIDKYSAEINEYKRHFVCYRYWQAYGEEEIKKYANREITHFTVRLMPYYSCTISLDNFRQMANNDEIIGSGFISSHEGNGVLVSQVLKDGLRKLDNPEDIKFVEETLFRNQHQAEVMFLDPITDLNENNIIGYFDIDSNVVVPL